MRAAGVALWHADRVPPWHPGDIHCGGSMVADVLARVFPEEAR